MSIYVSYRNINQRLATGLKTKSKQIFLYQDLYQDACKTRKEAGTSEFPL